jgi:hypothetical protein
VLCISILLSSNLSPNQASGVAFLSIAPCRGSSDFLAQGPGNTCHQSVQAIFADQMPSVVLWQQRLPGPRAIQSVTIMYKQCANQLLSFVMSVLQSSC